MDKLLEMGECDVYRESSNPKYIASKCTNQGITWFENMWVCKSCRDSLKQFFVEQALDGKKSFSTLLPRR